MLHHRGGSRPVAAGLSLALAGGRAGASVGDRAAWPGKTRSPLALRLNQVGCDVVAYDQRSYGTDAPGLGDFGEGGWLGMLSDLERLVQAECGQPVYVLGHSMGPMLADYFMTRHGDRVAGIILSGSPGSGMTCLSTSAASAAAPTIRSMTVGATSSGGSAPIALRASRWIAASTRATAMKCSTGSIAGR